MLRASDPVTSSPRKYLSNLEKLFSVSPNDAELMINAFQSEMKMGLSGQKSSLKMIPSFVDKPKGTEKGDFLALDLGGTNFRVLLVRLDGNGNVTVPANREFVIPSEVMHGTGETLFDFIGDAVHRFFDEHRMDREMNRDLAFTFSFPVDQTGIAAGRLITWTKGFTATGVEGKDVVSLLHEALNRKNIRSINIRALINDTVGTLAAGSYADPACDSGVIMGTGTNACYRERLSKIGKLKGMRGQGYMIVNTEWGNFDKVRPTRYDRILDRNSVNPGAMYLEKMVSGMYLGELLRLVLTDLMARDLVFAGRKKNVKYFDARGALKTEDMSRIEGDKTDRLDNIKQFLEARDITDTTLLDRILFKRLCRMVSTRSARLGAAAVSAVLTWMDPDLENLHRVGVDGSLFVKYPGFQAEMKTVFEELYGKKAERISLVHSKDGSGKGAAIIAAVAASAERAGSENPG